jgi:hypothetical protein
MHRVAEAGYEAGVDFIILGTKELTPSKSFDPCRIDDTYRVSGIMHIYGQFITRNGTVKSDSDISGYAALYYDK